MKTVIVLLTWQRINSLRAMLIMLARQTEKDFSIHISNGNLQQKRLVEKYAEFGRRAGKMDITVSHDGNDTFAFRRFAVGKKMAERGEDVVLFIDDDIDIPNTYIQNCLKQYEPKTYFSGFAWSFQDNGSDYYKKRTRLYNNDQKIHYGGTGVSMIDASVFLKGGIHKAPKEAYKVEDLWLSYYVQQVLKWNIKFMKIPGVKIGGGDRQALYRQVLRDDFNKADLLRMLVKKYKWKL